MSMSAKQIAIMLGGMLVVVPVAGYLGRTMGEAQNLREAPQQTANSEVATNVVAMVTRQDADGVTEADFTPEFLTNLGNWIQERTAANAKKHWDAAGVPESDRTLSNESVYVQAGSHKLAVVRIRMGATTPNAVIAGVVGPEMVRVTCLDSSGANVQLTSGPCDEKVREAFGTSMNPLRS
ncbi:MAG: hypothetical protein ACKVOP_02615 [Sphingomonadaceae bacterium]